jgi:hypothetical protein
MAFGTGSGSGRDMRDIGEDGDFAGQVRRAFRELVCEALPAAARSRGWPVARPADFERMLLDHVCGAPWETAVPGGRAGAVCPLDLALAVETGARVLEGSACLGEIARRSGTMRAAACDAPDALRPRDRGPTRL